jgi:diguanylate cyclase (GGDEF)-like protein/PAS domain S-box-containing protein
MVRRREVMPAVFTQVRSSAEQQEMRSDSEEVTPGHIDGVPRRRRPFADRDLDMLENLLAHLDGVVYRCRADEHWTTEFASAGALGLFGRRPEELIGKPLFAADAPILAEDRARVREEIMESIRARRRFFLEYRVIAPSGVVKWVADRGTGVFDPHGAVAWIEGFIEDVTERRLAQEALRVAEERYRSIFEHAVEGIFQSSPDGGYLRVNPALARTLGYDSPRELIAALPSLDRLYVDPGRREEFLHAMRGRGAVSNFESRVYRKDDSIIWVSESAHTVCNGAGEAVFFEGTVKEVSDSKLFEQQLLHQSNHDALTGLPNRSLLTDRLDQALRQAERHHSAVAVALVDLDQFKFINDSLGHNAGDALLKSVAERLRDCVRDYDTVARQGGDEFVLVIAGFLGHGRLSDQMRCILSAVSKPWCYKDVEYSTTCSVGVSVYPRDGADAETLLKNADVAMYRAKETGRNNFQFYTPDMSSKVSARLQTQGNLRRALERNEFQLHYQPKLDLETGRVIGLEALIRWDFPGEGMITPNRFVPIAEETGLIVPIGEWVLRTACRQLKALQAEGFPPVVVSVNLSPAQFRQRVLVATVERILAETALDPACLELEVTESLAMHDAAKFIDELQALKGLGVQLSIDDFGTGYCSLNYLKRFPIDRLKIDKSFVCDIDQDVDDAAIVKAVITLGHILNLRVLAEGVESAQQLDFLRANRCDEVQGFYFFRPLPIDEIRQLRDLRAHPVV